MSELHEPTDKITAKEHSDNISKICDEMDILRQVVFGMRQLSDATHVVGLEKISSELLWRANTIEEVMEMTIALIMKHQREELFMVSYEVEQLKQALKK